MGIPRWYAISVKHQHERQTLAVLAAKGLETLAPHYRATRRWSDRVKVLDLPLFPGYVFCRFPFRERVGVLNAPGIVKIVGFAGLPAPVEDREITAIQAVVGSNLQLDPWPFLKPGDRVVVQRGPLKGLEGTLLKERGRVRLVIGVELLQRAIAVALDPDMVVPAALATARRAVA